QEENTKRDNNPEAIAIRLKVFLTIKKFSSQNLRNALLKDYLNYLTHRKHAMRFRLTRQEELKCINWINFETDNEEKHYRLNFRKKLLHSEPLPIANNLHRPVPHTGIPKTFDNFNWLTPEIEIQMRSCLHHPIPIANRLRPGSDFVKNFLY